MKKILHIVDLIVKNVMHILQQSMTIRTCVKKLRNYGLN